MNNAFRELLEKLAHRPKVGERYVPKFSIGDYVLTKYKEQVIIALIRNINTNEDDKLLGQYTLQTVFNNMPKRGMNRQQSIQVIDKYYDLIRPETAQILYGIDIIKLTKDEV